MRALVLAVMLLSACAPRATERIGSPEVYARIEAITDCEALQREFDGAMTNAEARQHGDPLRKVSIAYADAAEDRMEKIGCYK